MNRNPNPGEQSPGFFVALYYISLSTSMTYGELLDMLSQLDEDQLEFKVMAQVDEEFYTVSELNIQEKEDRLKDGHPYFEIE